MFNDLVESGLQKKDYKRRGSFFIGTLATYGLLVLTVGVISICAYEVSLDEENDYEVEIIRWPSSSPTIVKDNKPKAGGGSRGNSSTNRPASFSNVSHPLQPRIPPDRVSSAPGPKIPGLFRGDNQNLDQYDTGYGGPIGPYTNGTGDSGDGRDESNNNRSISKLLNADEIPPAPKPTPQAKPKPRIVSKGPITGEAISRIEPPYPHAAKLAGVSGIVKVQILIDETGKVVSASAVSGHPLLIRAAVQAAHQWRFRPTMLGDQPVKVSGFINFDFNFN
jgi:TonB family protein